jgi:hypothetical protein
MKVMTPVFTWNPHSKLSYVFWPSEKMGSDKDLQAIISVMPAREQSISLSDILGVLLCR